MAYNKISELRQQMMALCLKAKSAGANLADVIPQEMREHFQDLHELQEAKQYIRECEDREKGLEEDKLELQRELDEAKKRVEDVPDEHKQMRIDIKQSERQVQFWKKLCHREEERAADYQRQWSETLKRQSKFEYDEAKLAKLEKECAEQKTVIMQLLQDNREAADTFKWLREQDTQVIALKDEQMAQMMEYAKRQEERYRNTEEESDQFEETYNDLVLRQQTELDEIAETVNRQTLQSRSYERQNAAAATEARIMRQYYERSNAALVIFQRIFQQLLRPDTQTVWLPDSLEATLKSGARDVEMFQIISDSFKQEGLEVGPTREELAGLNRSAIKMQMSLEDIAIDVRTFLNQLAQKPDLWYLLRRKFSRLR